LVAEAGTNAEVVVEEKLVVDRIEGPGPPPSTNNELLASRCCARADVAHSAAATVASRNWFYVVPSSWFSDDATKPGWPGINDPGARG
jgi:hypothetical protein